MNYNFPHRLKRLKHRFQMVQILVSESAEMVYRCLQHLRMVEVVDDYKPGDVVEAMCDEDQTWYTAVVQDSSWVPKCAKKIQKVPKVMQKLIETGAITTPDLCCQICQWKERFGGSYVVLWDDPGDSPETSLCRPRYMTLGY